MSRVKRSDVSNSDSAGKDPLNSTRPGSLASASRRAGGPAGNPSIEVLRALSDPVRWSIIQQLGDVDELACSSLEHTLNVSKPTISYHTKILVQAGLMSVRKEGRHFFYTLRPEALRAVIDEVWALAPGPVPVHDGQPDFRAAPSVRRRKTTSHQIHRVDGLAAGGENDPVVLTW
jgi:DNA-binding transcriptional ArsR family regulator